jgi:DNA polymerase V
MSAESKKISVSTRFHSWAENDFSISLDLNDLLIKNKTATFFVRIEGNSFLDSGISSGDIVIVDRTLSLTHNKIIIARVFDELVIRRILFQQNQIFLVSDNDALKPIQITPETEFELWGIVTYVIHQL